MNALEARELTCGNIVIANAITHIDISITGVCELGQSRLLTSSKVLGLELNSISRIGKHYSDLGFIVGNSTLGYLDLNWEELKLKKDKIMIDKYSHFGIGQVVITCNDVEMPINEVIDILNKFSMISDRVTKLDMLSIEDLCDSDIDDINCDIFRLQGILRE